MALFDGGLVSNVPTDGVANKDGKTLVLLTRQFGKLPNIAGRTYVQPSQPIPVSAWDCTAPMKPPCNRRLIWGGGMVSSLGFIALRRSG